MNDVQAWQATYARHERVLARERRADAARTAEEPKFAGALPAPAKPLEAGPPAATIAAPAPAPAAPAAATAPAAIASAAPVDMSGDQLAMLMAAFGSAEPEPGRAADAAAPAPAAKPEPVVAAELTPDQAALLMQSFGIAGYGYGDASHNTPDNPSDDSGSVSTAAPNATATTEATGRFFPVQPSRQTAALDASDAYLSAMHNLDRSLARRGIR